MESFLTFVWEKSPIIAVILFAIVVTGAVVWWAAKFYGKVKHTESGLKEVKSEIHEVAAKMESEVKEVKKELREVAVQMEAKIAECATKADLAALDASHKTDLVALRAEHKSDIMALKENDFYHTNKAILILAKLMLSKDKDNEAVATGFEWLKDTVLESTPDSRKEDIKSITL